MKKYYLTSQFKIMQLGSGLALSALIATLLYLIKNIPIFNLFLFILLGYTIFSAIYWAKEENISVSEKGIEYQGPEIAFNTNWDNTEKISSGWHFPFKTEGMVVDKSLVRMSKISIGTIKRFPLWVSSQKVFIPLSCFSENWRDSELGQKIKQYAPHLFQKEKSA